MDANNPPPDSNEGHPTEMPPPAATPPIGRPTAPLTASNSARDNWPYAQEPDPGSRRSRLIALIVAVIATLTAVSLQNAPAVIELFSPAPVEAVGVERDIPPPTGADMGSVMGKLFIKVAEFLKSDPTAMSQLDVYAASDVDRARFAIVAAEVNGKDAALGRLDSLDERVDDDDPLATDIRLLHDVYEEGPDAINDDERERLIAHHGYFAKVALTFALDEDDAAREALRGGGLLVVSMLLAAGALIFIAFVAGIGFFIVAVVYAANGKLRPSMPVPAPGGSVFLEVFAIFIAGFVLLNLSMDLVTLLAPQGATWPAYLRLGSQWLLLLAPLWPLARGMSGERLRAAIGLHTGRGLFKEMGCGVAAYFAGLPVFLAGAIISVVLMFLAQALRMKAGLGEPQTPTNPVFELVSAADPLALFMVFTLATIWAPLCEELIFRGALLRHLRGHMSIAAAVLLGATIFGFMHGYGPLLVFPLIALGSVFGVMRVWRGSLIPCITAHALHNGTVLTLAITTLKLLGE
ncbi:MAG: hypothetical protein CMJ31_07415 [Phycisphaerae bacterium]|nr:hypothetical protein [Phycisphaerae bacterium]